MNDWVLCSRLAGGGGANSSSQFLFVIISVTSEANHTGKKETQCLLSRRSWPDEAEIYIQVGWWGRNIHTSIGTSIQVGKAHEEDGKCTSGLRRAVGLEWERSPPAGGTNGPELEGQLTDCHLLPEDPCLPDGQSWAAPLPGEVGPRCRMMGGCCHLLAFALLTPTARPPCPPPQVPVAQQAQSPGGGSPEAQAAFRGSSLQSSPPGRILSHPGGTLRMFSPWWGWNKEQEGKDRSSADEGSPLVVTVVKWRMRPESQTLCKLMSQWDLQGRWPQPWACG